MVRIHGDFTARMAMRSEKLGKERIHLLVFLTPLNNAVIYCYYLITYSEESTEEEAKGGDDSKNNHFISLSRFELLE